MYKPIVLNVALGFSTVEAGEPPEKSHVHEVGAFVARLIKLTVPPTGIIIGSGISAVKSTTGGAFTGSQPGESNKEPLIP